MKNKIISIIFCTSFLILPFTSSAEESQSKTYFNAGMMFLSMDSLNDLKGTGVTIDDDATVVTLGVGYNVSPSIALEAGILTGEEISATIPGMSGTINGNAFTFSGSGTVKAKANNTYLFGIKYSSDNDSPLNFNAKTGAMYWDIDYLASLNGTLTYLGTQYAVTSEYQFDTQRGIDPYYGFGVTYDLSNTSSFGLDYFTSEIHNDSISGFSVAFVSKF